ncbi:Chromatin structure-remodeling complex subunit rsc7 [Colletotrichum gloeosporioides]|uniref:Chromatin structure-remodeling complex subunit rsc7 n=1 Tax=Colletotrichum gloeosporioides TaxID=474922 RepID=A0A8H4CFL4_COLGL|nr:Chromatin structure-remodeling complex subunit rsc7 [Colletotrichum gloeosporioides]KAF3803006.1 Chromatin structure-remodeling complex subunit rsc7 [Colletotrichum gloeosporioides]
MYSTQPNGADSATINPAALNSPDLLNASLRGIKRSRSPDSFLERAPAGGAARVSPPGSFPQRATQYKLTSRASSQGDSNPRKRGKSLKGRTSETAGQAPVSNMPQTIPPPQTPQNQAAPLPGGQAVAYAPAQASPPPKTTPTKTTLKALPTVRDHTTDQLNAAGDEYLPREIDEFGEKKVMPNGQLLGGREYKCRTFLVPNRGDKLFMLATECARVLGYRDSYLLFNKNRSLYKIIASQPEKDDLVSQEILPFSYRSRQIAIVTARSMFRQFGSRVITNGRRVRDDYWETKARKQGFTEADLAGEKRPGAAKAREAAAEAQNQVMMGGPHGEIVYSNTPSQFPGAPQPQIVQPGSELSDNRPRDYSGILKGGPRQEITGPAYQDQTRPAQIGEVHAQAHHAAEYNRSLNQQRDMRGDYLQGIWRRPHEQPQSSNLAQAVTTSDAAAPTTRATQSPHTSASGMPQSGIVPNQSPQMMMTAPPYSQSIHAQNPISQAPMRGSASNMPQGAQGYHYPASGQMWPQTQQTPQHNYSGYTTQNQQSHQQSPAPQLRHATSGVQPAMQFPGMPGMGQNYGAGQAMYPTDQTPRQYMPQPNQGSPAVTQAWSNQQTPAQWWTNQPQ